VAIALPIVAVHVFGLPFGILVLIRLLARSFDAVRALRRRIHRAALAAIGVGSVRHPTGGSAPRCPEPIRPPST
jgi:hypothetical protein